MAKFELPKDSNPLANSPLFQTQDEQEQPVKRGRGRPTNSSLVKGVSVQEGLTAEYRRATYILRVDIVEKIADLAYTERKAVKDVMQELLDDALGRVMKKYEKEGLELLHKEK